MAENNLMDKIVSLCKRRGFIFPNSEIYGGLANTWDYGPYGVELKNNIKQRWWKKFVVEREDMVGLDAAIIMNPKTWEASGHLTNFTDPLAECLKCKKRFRADELPSADSICPECGGKLSAPRNFNLLFKTFIGPAEASANIAYLRPETAQGIFTNFKNVMDTMRPKLPFGIGQIGKAFRNEITPGNFIFRTREFEQLEIEYFIKEEGWEKIFDDWKEQIWEWIDLLGIKRNKVRECECPPENRAHYSKKTIDFEYEFPFGRSELYGLAYRADYDLKQHAKFSGVNLICVDEAGNKFTPHAIEPSLGVERTVLAVLCESYNEEAVNDGTRVVMKFPRWLAPVKIAVFPLLKNKPELVKKAKMIYDKLKFKYRCEFDDNGNIGKRYRRQDEIGAPYCLTVDFNTLTDETVTVRERDSMKQSRIKISELIDFFYEKFN